MLTNDTTNAKNKTMMDQTADLIEKEDQGTDPLKEKYQKLNDRLEALARAKKRMKEEFKEREAKKRQAKIFLIGEFYEHYGILNLDKKIIMGIIGVAVESLDDPDQVKKWKDVGSTDFKKFEEIKAARLEAKKLARKNEEKAPSEKVETAALVDDNKIGQSVSDKDDKEEGAPA